MGKAYLVVVCFLSIFLVAPLSFADCASVEILYKQAISEPDSSKRIDLLQQTIKECPTFNAFYELGKAFLQADQLRQSEIAFLNANRKAGNRESQAKAFYGLAHVYEAMGLENDALMRLRDAKEYDPENENIKNKWLELELALTKRILPSDYIIRSIRDTRASKVGKPKKIRFSVNFEVDEHEFTFKGKKQVEELAKALGDAENSKLKFIIDGHTDSRGSDKHNHELSIRRAREVKNYILANTSISENRLKIMAFGETKLLSLENTKEAHMINRRVEIRCRPLQ